MFWLVAKVFIGGCLGILGCLECYTVATLLPRHWHAVVRVLCF